MRILFIGQKHHGDTHDEIYDATEELTQAICENIELGLSYVLSCKAEGISFETFTSWMRRGTTGKEKKYSFLDINTVFIYSNKPIV